MKRSDGRAGKTAGTPGFPPDDRARRRRGRRFGAWQIEITNRCALRCTMCPRASGGTARPTDMSLEDFGRILPHLSDVEHVVLEGWGESTLHPHLAELVGLARTMGPRVGFVTGGAGLDEDTLERIVEKGLDFIGFSLAGATPRTHEAIRRGSDLERLFELIGSLVRRKGMERKGAPRVHVVFSLQRSNVSELPLLVRRAAELGVKVINLVNAVHIETPDQDRERAFEYGGGEPACEKFVAEAKALARKLNVELLVPGLVARETAVCAENPLRNLYVSVEGDVSPCVFLSPPSVSSRCADGHAAGNGLRGPVFRRIFRGEERLVERVAFGNLFREPFHGIWEREAYAAFRARFEGRKGKMEELFELLLKPSAPADSRLPDPPLPCATCHKLFGL